MAAKRIEDWSPRELKYRRCYSRADFENILAALRTEIQWSAKLRLRKDIEAAAKDFRLHRALQHMPPPFKLAKRLGRIEGAVQRLLKALGIPPEGDTLDIPLALRQPLMFAAWQSGDDIDEYADSPAAQWSTEEQIYVNQQDSERIWQAIVRITPLRSAIDSIRLLRSWAGSARRKLEGQVEQAKVEREAPRKPDTALHKFVADLAGAYERAFNRAAGISHPAYWGEPHGPFIRFLQACLKPLSESRSAGAIRELWRRTKHNSASQTQAASKFSDH